MNIVPNRLITFGDSWTAGHGIETDIQLDRDLVFSDLLLDYEKQNNISVWEYDFKYPNTWQNTEGGDTHPNYLGYKIIANKLKKLLNDYSTSSSTE